MSGPERAWAGWWPSAMRQAQGVLSDINPTALELARINAGHAGVDFAVQHAGGLDGALVDLDLIVSNPPYVAGESGRAYKDGGDLHGARLSLDWAVAGMRRLAPGGRFILYTGSGSSTAASTSSAKPWSRPAAQGCQLSYRELDPDISPANCAGRPTPTPSGSRRSAR